MENTNYRNRFPTTFRRFQKISQNCSEGLTNVSEHFRTLSEDRRRFPKIAEDLREGVLVAAGDVITQQFVEQRGTDHDFRRTARMGVVGLVIGPVLRSWYLTLDRIVPGAAKTAGFKKMLLDQSLFAPLMICFFFGVSETLNGKRPHEIKEMLRERYVQALITNYKVWPLAQTLNFTFIPIQHRVGFVQVVAIFWNAYLSWMANKSLPDAALSVKDPIELVQ